jgi:hypothetical protein
MRANTAYFEVWKSCTAMPTTDWHLNLQFGRLVHADRGSEFGYRFIWKDDAGKLRAQRAGALIPTLADMDKLRAIARKEGWDGLDGRTLPPDATAATIIPKRIRAVLDGDKRLYCGVNSDIVRQLLSSSFGGEASVDEFIKNASARARAVTGKSIRNTNPDDFVDDLIAVGELQEVSIGGKIA